jgi:hypothetical protein
MNSSELSTDLSAGILTSAASAVRAVSEQGAHPDSAGKARRRARRDVGDEADNNANNDADLLASSEADQQAHQFDGMA